MSAALEFRYDFRFEDGAETSFVAELDPVTLISKAELEGEPPPWARLDSGGCEGCGTCRDTYCPVAVRLVKPMQMFGSYKSFTPVEVTVTTPERSYVKKTDMQDALRSLFGFLMATSGCPAMRNFRPMARFHLPFASMEETLYRTCSSYLLARYFSEGAKPGPLEIDLQAVTAMYETVAHINRAMVNRLRQAKLSDSGLNAIVFLDCFANLIPMSLEDGMKEISSLFGS